jgi:hypothetical protein
VLLRLPFPFPFYDKVYREVRVFPEEYLRFDAGMAPACYDEYSFHNATAIFPIAGWLRTNGGSQPNQGVFVPVNFAVMLRANGEVRFQHGEGNQNVLKAPPFGGCSLTAPAVGISRGDRDTIFLPAVSYARVNLRNAPTVTLTPHLGHAPEPKVRPADAGGERDGIGVGDGARGGMGRRGGDVECGGAVGRGVSGERDDQSGAGGRVRGGAGAGLSVLRFFAGN